MNLFAEKGNSFEALTMIEILCAKRYGCKLVLHFGNVWRGVDGERNVRVCDLKQFFLICLTVNEAHSVELFATDTYCNIHPF